MKEIFQLWVSDILFIICLCLPCLSIQWLYMSIKIKSNRNLVATNVNCYTCFECSKNKDLVKHSTKSLPESSKNLSGVVSQRMSKVAPNGISEVVPDEALAVAPNGISEVVPEEALAVAPNGVSEVVPEEAPGPTVTENTKETRESGCDKTNASTRLYKSQRRSNFDLLDATSEIERSCKSDMIDSEYQEIDRSKKGKKVLSREDMEIASYLINVKKMTTDKTAEAINTYYSLLYYWIKKGLPEVKADFLDKYSDIISSIRQMEPEYSSVAIAQALKSQCPDITYSDRLICRMLDDFFEDKAKILQPTTTEERYTWAKKYTDEGIDFTTNCVSIGENSFRCNLQTPAEIYKYYIAISAKQFIVEQCFKVNNYDDESNEESQKHFKNFVEHVLQVLSEDPSNSQIKFIAFPYNVDSVCSIENVIEDADYKPVPIPDCFDELTPVDFMWSNFRGKLFKFRKEPGISEEEAYRKSIKSITKTTLLKKAKMSMEVIGKALKKE